MNDVNLSADEQPVNWLARVMNYWNLNLENLFRWFLVLFMLGWVTGWKVLEFIGALGLFVFFFILLFSIMRSVISRLVLWFRSR